ncbi:MAG: type II toxin-antitoxin system PemK/MazF family toxin [Candidatus Eremiobacteraeota bacterium]|nr:type II toxin-antitoxin system PemK/MazF family toxin [Candidatus Eremiobacteraeota bacterium]
MTPRRWEIYQAALDPHQGSEQGGSRPAVVISRDSINCSLPVIAVLPVTSYKSPRRIYSTEVLIPGGMAGLPMDSLILAHQIRTIARSRLLKLYGKIEDEAIQEKIEAAVRIFLDLEKES